MGVHRNIDANFLRGVMPKVPSKKHPYENFGMPYVFLWILQDRLFYYSQSGKKEGEERLEIDFLTVRPFPDARNKPRVTPIEVKSSVRFRTVSLDRFVQKFRERIGNEIVVYPGPLRKEGRRLLVPLYAAHCL